MSEGNNLIKFALERIAESKALNLKIAALDTVSEANQPKAGIEAMREYLEDQGYRTRFEPELGCFVVEWD